jgi:hypothetical protein
MTVTAQEAGLQAPVVVQSVESATPTVIQPVQQPALTGLSGGAAAADAPEPDFRVSVDLSAGLSYDTNEELEDPSPGDTTRANLGATFGLVNETLVSRLAASVLTEMRYESGPGEDDGIEFRIPLGTLSYEREGIDSFATLNGRYFYDRVDDDVLVFLDEDLNPVDLLVDGGDLRRWTLDGRVGFGQASPIGAEAGFYYDNRDYIDVTDPDLYDRTDYGVDGVLSFSLTPTLRGRVTGAISRLEEDDVTETVTDTRNVGIGANYDIDAATVFSGDVAYTSIEETFFDTLTDTTEGWVFDFSLQREVSNGTVGAALSRTLTEAVERTELTFARAMELPSGELSYTLGVSVPDSDGDTRFVGDVTYARELPSGSFSVSASQDTVTSDDEEDTLVTRVAVDYNYEINSVSSLGLNFGLGRSEDIGGGTSDTDVRANAGVTYRHALTREWDWLLGYEARYSIEDGGDAATGNRVYTLIDRRFAIRP